MDLLTHTDARLAELPAQAPICIALSGGLDSVVLLDLLVRRRGARTLGAVHVHHGLSAHADAWADFCAALCARHSLPLAIERVRVDRSSGLGIEAAARAARQAVFAARPEPIVALAHHRDDQAETLLLQVLRGTGVKGLAAMPRERRLGAVTLWRPLLEVPRAALLEYAKGQGLEWVEDDSNASLRHDRNFLRHDIGPRLDARFPGWREAAVRLAQHAAAADALLGEIAPADEEGLVVDRALDPARRAHAVRAFLAAHGLAMPSAARLAQMVSQLYEGREDARIRIAHDGAVLARHRGRVRIERGLPPSGASPWSIPWHGEACVELGPGRGAVSFEAVVGAGLARRAVACGEWHFSPRHGGERIRLAPERPRRTLKNLLREAQVPVWRRTTLPLLFADGRLAWVPGLGVAAEFACAPGEPGLLPDWRPAPAVAVPSATPAP